MTVKPDGDWPAVREAFLKRAKALGVTTAELARRTGLSETTIRYFGESPATPGTVTLLNSALRLPNGHLLATLRGERVEKVALPDTVT